jgi:hypothetical protein
VIDLIENPHMIFTDEQGKFISIDEAALKEALDSGHVASAAIDVFEDEPKPFDKYD